MTVSSAGVPTPTPQDHECDGTSTCPATDHVDDCVGEALQARWCDEHGQPGLTCSVCAAAGSGVPTPQEPEITEEMIAAGAQAMRDEGFVDWDDDTVPTFVVATSDPGVGRIHSWVPPEQVARAVLEAALAGRTVVELPEPNADVYVGQARSVLVWDTGGDFTVTAKGGSFGARVNIRGGPYLTADAAEARATALLAAAREARRLASESRKDGETPEADPYPRYYRWGQSHFYRVISPDEVWFRSTDGSQWVPSGARRESDLLNAETATYERYYPEDGGPS